MINNLWSRNTKPSGVGKLTGDNMFLISDITTFSKKSVATAITYY